MACIFKTTSAFTIGVHAAALLARSGKALLQTREIARICEVSEAHLAKVMQKLVRSGFVKSVRGPSGGFELSESAKEMSLMDLWQVIEGPSDNKETCPLAIPACQDDRCIIGRVFMEQNRKIEKLMKHTRILDLGRKLMNHFPDVDLSRQRECVCGKPA